MIIHCNLLIYADDVKISSADDMVLLQSNLQRLFDWCRSSGLKLNIKKCKIMSILRRKTPFIGWYLIDGSVLEKVISICDLDLAMRNG